MSNPSTLIEVPRGKVFFQEACVVDLGEATMFAYAHQKISS